MRAAAALAILTLVLAAEARAQAGGHVCGDGPRAVTIRDEIDCPCSGAAPQLLADGSYLVGTSCPATTCYATAIEWWSDWPGCPGSTRLQGLPAGYWGRSITGDDLPISFPPDPEPQPEETP